MSDLRQELTALPERIKKLPVHRGYPVPWFVAWVNEEPEFRALDFRKWVTAVRDRLCWVCGDPLGANLCFVIGPMCAVNLTTSEPPAHHECAVWSAENCPFLSRPHMARRENDLPEGMMDPAGNCVRRNPGATVLWTTRSYELFETHERGRYLITIGAPTNIEAYAGGKPTSLDVVLESIRTGEKLLREACDMEPTSQQRIFAHKACDLQLEESNKLLATYLRSDGQDSLVDQLMK